MGNFYKDAQRAETWIINSLHAWGNEPLTAKEISLMLRANTNLQFGERKIKDLLEILEIRGYITKQGDKYKPRGKP